MIPEIFDNNTQASPSPRKTDDHILTESELSLSLRLQTTTTSHDDEKLDNKEELSSFAISEQNKKLRRTHHDLSGMSSTMHNAATSPPNRKTRISVRARCEQAKVSSIIFINLGL